MSALPARFRRGTTLVEFVAASALTAILMIGLHSCLIIALKSLPDQGVAQAVLRANQIADQLATELESALFVSERSATAIRFTVPDRNGDGADERIYYSWTGTPGGPLTRSYNGGPSVIIADSVDLFTLTGTTVTQAETYPGEGLEDGAETLLIDDYGTSGTGNNDVAPATWVGQYFTYTLPADTYAWRPTRVQFMAKKNTVPGQTLVQIRPVTSTLSPSTTVSQQWTLLDSDMTTAYAYQTYNISAVDPLPSGGGFCLVLQNQSGAKSVTAQSATVNGGLLKTTNTGSTWSNDGSKNLVCQLYGKLTRASGTQTLNVNYLTSLAITLKMNSYTPQINTTASLINCPDELDGKWELLFDKNPTTLDINGDGSADWSVVGGGTFSMAQIVNGVWQPTTTQLVTGPSNNFSHSTIIDLRLQNTAVGGTGAVFSGNFLRSGSTCAPVNVNLIKQADGTQTLSIATKSNDATTVPILSVTALPAAEVVLQLIVDATNASLSIRANDVQYGNFPLTPFVSGDSSAAIKVGGGGSACNFSYVRIRVLKQ